MASCHLTVNTDGLGEWRARQDWDRNHNTKGWKSRRSQEIKIMNSQNFNNSIFQYPPSAPIPLLVCDTCNVTREDPRVWYHCSRFPCNCWLTKGRVPKNETMNNCRASNGQYDIPKSPAQSNQKNSANSSKKILFHRHQSDTDSSGSLTLCFYHGPLIPYLVSLFDIEDQEGVWVASRMGLGWSSSWHVLVSDRKAKRQRCNRSKWMPLTPPPFWRISYLPWPSFGAWWLVSWSDHSWWCSGPFDLSQSRYFVFSYFIFYLFLLFACVHRVPEQAKVLSYGGGVSCVGNYDQEAWLLRYCPFQNTSLTPYRTDIIIHLLAPYKFPPFPFTHFTLHFPLCSPRSRRPL